MIAFPLVHFGYRGELTINGMVHLRARDYSPMTARFTTRDSLDGVPGTPTLANSYHYSDNDPFNKVDPLGLRATDASFSVSYQTGGDSGTYLVNDLSPDGRCICDVTLGRRRAVSKPRSAAPAVFRLGAPAQ